MSGNKSRTMAGVLAILLGDFGIHKFYLGNTKMGVIYLLFSWTGIPALVGLVEGIQYFMMKDEEFAQKFPG